MLLKLIAIKTSECGNTVAEASVTERVISPCETNDGLGLTGEEIA